MAGEPAIRKVIAALEALLSAADIGNVMVDRTQEEPLGNVEMPAINILHTGTAFEVHDHGTTLHRASIDLDMIVAASDASSIGARHAEMEAAIVSVLHADPTVGGLAQDTIPQSSEGVENVFTEEGARLLKIEILFLTPLGDHRTVIGPGGIVP